MGTGKDIAEYANSAYDCGGGYIWGQQGAVWSAEKQEQLAKKYRSDPSKYANYKGSVEYGAKWAGHRVWDCSGLTRQAAWAAGADIHNGSNSTWLYDCKKKGQLENGMELPIGAFVFTGTADKKPHIGTYTGGGMVTEAAGAKTGVVRSKLFGGKWKYWGLCKGVDFEDIPEPVPPDPSKHPTLRKGSRGEQVRIMQQRLLAHGEELPRYGVDGAFGNETLKALKQFQRKNGLVVDGICGPKSWAALEEGYHEN